MEKSGYAYRGSSLEGNRRYSDTRRRKRVTYTRQYDFALLFLTVGIALFGVIMIYSAGVYTAALKNNPFRYVKTQMLCLVIGTAVMVMVSMFDYQVLMQKIFHTRFTLVHILYVVAMFFQGIVLFIGERVRLFYLFHMLFICGGGIWTALPALSGCLFTCRR